MYNLGDAQKNLLQQVQNGWINYTQALAELDRLRNANLTEAQTNLQQQVDAGHISSAQAAAEVQRLGSLSWSDFTNATGGSGWDNTERDQNGNPLAPITGTASDNGILVTPTPSVDTAEDAIRTQQDYADYSLQEQLQANRVNEVNPYGASSYTTDPETGQITRTTTLSDDQQALLDTQESRDLEINSQIKNLLSQLAGQGSYDLSGLDSISDSDLLTERQRVEDSIYNDYLSKNDDRWTQEYDQLRQSLVDRGLDPTSGRGLQELQDLRDQQDEERQTALASAITTAGNQYKINYDTALSKRQQDVSEYGDTYYSGWNKLKSLLGLETGVTDTKYDDIGDVDVSTVDAASIANAYNDQDLQKYIADLQAQTDIDVANIQAGASEEDDSSSWMNLDVGDITGKNDDDHSWKSLSSSTGKNG